MKLDDSSFLLSNHAFKIAALLWFFGFLCALMPLAAYEAQSILLAVLSVGFAALFALSNGDNFNLRVLIRSLLLSVALAFWVLALLSVILSEARSVSFIYFMIFSLLPLSFLLYVRALHVYGMVLAVSLAGLLALLAGFSVVQFLWLPDWLFKGAPHWPFANPNILAAMLSLGMLGGMGWMLGAPDRRQSNLALALAGLCLVVMLMTGARGALLSIVIFGIVMVVFAGAFARKHRRCLSALAVIGLGASLILTLIVKLGIVTAPGAALDSIARPGVSLISGRLDIWGPAYEIFKDHLWSGTGIGTFFLFYPAYRGGDLSTAGLMAHSEPLQFAVEMGIAAPILFYAFIILAVHRTFKAIGKIEPDDPQRLMVLAPFCALGALILHAHISYHFHVPSLLLVMGLVMGFWYVQTARVLQNVAASSQFPHTRWVAALAIMCGLALFAPLQASDILVSRAGPKLDQGRMDDFVNDINRAGKISAGHNARAMIAAVNIPISVLQLNTPFMPKEEAQAMFDQAMNLLDRAEVLNPHLPQINYHRAELLSFTQPFLDINSENSVEDYLKAALKTDPLHLPSRVMLANLYMRTARREEALALLKDGEKWPYYRQNPAFFYEKLAGLAEDMGDGETAKRAAQILRAYRPGSAAPEQPAP